MQRLSQWLWPTSRELGLAAERHLLRHVQADVRIHDVAVPAASPGEQEHSLHTLSIYPPAGTASSRAPFVLVPGYAAGAAMYGANLDALARAGGAGDGRVDTEVHAVDQTGNGLSSRPRWRTQGLRDTEEFFVENLEAWREASGLERMTLVGHSFGGYMSAVYALRYPERVERLVLVSPVGVPERPEDERPALRDAPLWVKGLLKFFRWLWARGVTPQGIVRFLGPWGVNIVNGYVRRRFNDEVDKDALAPYLYHISAARGSSEYALQVRVAARS